METKFQTSFIPKKPIPFAQPGAPVSMAAARKVAQGGGGSIFMTLAVVIFSASILSIAGTYAWKAYLLNAQGNLSAQFDIERKNINTDQIALIQAQSNKIAFARQLLSNHLSISNIFSIIGMFTAESIRFQSMDLTVSAGTAGPMQLTLSGYGRGYNSVAFQSDVLNSLDKYGIRKSLIKNVIITNPGVNQNGTVSFGFTAQVDPSEFLYSKTVTGPSSQPASASDDSDAAQEQH